jgi:hypothetical protein
VTDGKAIKMLSVSKIEIHDYGPTPAFIREYLYNIDKDKSED